MSAVRTILTITFLDGQVVKNDEKARIESCPLGVTVVTFSVCGAYSNEHAVLHPWHRIRSVLYAPRLTQ